YEKILKVDPNNKLVEKALEETRKEEAELDIEHAQVLENADKTIEKCNDNIIKVIRALEIDPGNINVLHKLGDVYYDIAQAYGVYADFNTAKSFLILAQHSYEDVLKILPKNQELRNKVVAIQTLINDMPEREDS
ncbi:MAG: hypothetical protein KKA19_05510, partial [Candidatus Margulisbacteria bacterium]|nr:hypothetical protein [Candidatus Margulisiibacteriota bacterium]